MRQLLLIALLASLLFASAWAACSPTCYCCDPDGSNCRNCETSSETQTPTAKLAFNADVNAVVPSSGFVPDNTERGCLFNCEWFVRTARRDDPTRPCTLQRGRNGKFRENCVQEQVCTGCKNSLVMLRQPFYTSTSDVTPRCPRFPEDLDALTAVQLSTARDVCRKIGLCTCVSGTIAPEVLSVKE